MYSNCILNFQSLITLNIIELCNISGFTLTLKRSTKTNLKGHEKMSNVFLANALNSIKPLEKVKMRAFLKPIFPIRTKKIQNFFPTFKF